MSSEQDGARIQASFVGDAAQYGEGFHRLPAVKPPPGLEALDVSFRFACNTSRDRDQALVRFGIHNGAGELALVCGLRGIVQASEFSTLLGRMGYERKGVFQGAAGTFAYAYFPGTADDPTTTRNELG